MYLNRKMKKIMSSIVSLVLVVALVIGVNTKGLYINAEEEIFEPNQVVMPLLSNRLKNERLNYGPAGNSITNWSMGATYDVNGSGVDGVNISSTIGGGLNGGLRGRVLKANSGIFPKTYSNYVLANSNDGAGPFRGLALRTAENNTTNPDAAFFYVAQTVDLTPGYIYRFRAEVSTNDKARGVLNIYPGTATSGTGAIKSDNFTATKEVQVFETVLDLREATSGKYTVSIRNIANETTDKVSELRIHRVGFFLDDDYDLQNELNDLFVDETYTQLLGGDLTAIDTAIKRIQEKLGSDIPYSADVKTHVQEKISVALNLYNQIKALEDKINSFYTDGAKTSVAGDIDESIIAGLMDELQSITSVDFHQDLSSSIDRLNNVMLTQRERPKAYISVEEYAEQARVHVNNLTYLSNDQKLSFVDEIETALYNVKISIDQSINIEMLNNHIEKVINDFEGIKVKASLSDRKTQSDVIISKSAGDLQTVLDALINLTAEERTSARNEINKVLEDYKLEISNVATIESVDIVEQNTLSRLVTIQDIYTAKDVLKAAKINATAELQQNLTTLIQDAKALTNISDLEKEQIESLITNQTNHYKDLIEQSVSVEEVLSNKVDGLLLTNKELVRAYIVNEGNTANLEIQTLFDLTPEEVAEANAEVLKLRDQGIGAILDNASTLEEVAGIKSQSINEIKTVVDKYTTINNDRVEAKRIELRGELETLSNQLITSIQQMMNSSQTAKDQSIQLITEELNRALESISTLTTIATITAEGDRATAEMNRIYNLIAVTDSRAHAIKTLTEYAEQQKIELSTLEYMDVTETSSAKSKITSMLSEALININTLNSVKEITDYSSEIMKNMRQVYTDNAFINKQRESLDLLKKENERLLELIEQIEDVLDSEKQNAKIEINEVLAASNEKVMTTIDYNQFDIEVANGIEEMRSIYDMLMAKNEANVNAEKSQAIESLRAAAQAQVDVIEKLVNLSTDELNSYKILIEEFLNNAISALDSLETIAQIEDKVATTIVEFKNVADDAVLSDAKIEAIRELEEQSKVLKEVINDIVDVQESERNQAIIDIDTKLVEAISAVNLATSRESMVTVKSQGMADMQRIVDNLQILNDQNLAKAKANSSSVLEEAALNSIKAINELTYLSSTQKELFVEGINMELENALTKISADVTSQISMVKDIENEYIVILNTRLSEAQLVNGQLEAKAKLQSQMNVHRETVLALEDVTDQQKIDAYNALELIVDTANTTLGDSLSIDEVDQIVSNALIQMESVTQNLKEINDTNVQAKRLEVINALSELIEEQKAIITALPHITSDEQLIVFDSLDVIFVDAQSAIQEATTVSSIQSIGESSRGSIISEVQAQILENEKRDAIDKLTKATSVAKETIGALVDISDEDLNNAISQIDSYFVTYTTGIKDSLNLDEVQSSYKNGITEIQKIVDDMIALNTQNVTNAKVLATSIIRNSALEQNKIIDALSDLSESQKEEIKSAINTRVEQAISEIDQKETIATINALKDTTIDEILKLSLNAQLENEKIIAINELNQVSDSIATEIRNLADITNEERDSALVELLQARDLAIGNVNAASTIESVRPIKEIGITSMNSILDSLTSQNQAIVEEARGKAKANLSLIASEQKAIIDALAFYSEEAKIVAKKAIDDALDNAITKIDEATTITRINDISSETMQTFEAIVSASKLEDSKLSSKLNLNVKLDELITIVNSLEDVSLTSKESAISELKAALEFANEAIMKSTTVEEVLNEETTGKVSMQSIVDALVSDNELAVEEAREAAKLRLESEVNAVKARIDALENHTEEEKREAKLLIDQLAADELRELTNLTTVKEIENRISQSITDLNAIASSYELEDKKRASVKVLNDQLIKAVEEIKTLSDISQDDIIQAQAELEAEFNRAKESIISKVSIIEIDDEVVVSETAMQGIVDRFKEKNAANLQEAKNQATEVLNTLANDAITEINAMDHLSEETKQLYTDLITTSLESGLMAIDSSKTIAAVENFKNATASDFMETIDKSVLENTKNGAIDDLQSIHDSLVKVVSELADITIEDKTKVSSNLNTIKNEAIKNILSSVDAIAVKTEYENALRMMQNEVDAAKAMNEQNLVNAKSLATERLKEEADSAKEKIMMLSHLSNEEKEVLVLQITSALETSVGEILNVTTISDIKHFEDNTTQQFIDIVGEAELKNSKYLAIENIQKEIAKVKDEIILLEDISQAEKDSSFLDLDNIKILSSKNISDAVKIVDINQVENQAINDIKTILDNMRLLNSNYVAAARAKAIEILNQKLISEKADVESLSHLSDDQKAFYLNQIEEELSKTIELLSSANTVAKINGFKEEGLQTISNVGIKATFQNDKHMLLEELLNSAGNHRQTIASMIDVTDSDRETANLGIENIISSVKTKINEAITSEELENIGDLAKAEMQQIVDELQMMNDATLASARQQAIQKLESLVNDHKAMIDELKNLSVEEKAHAKQLLDDAYRGAKDLINLAKTSSEINAIVNNTEQSFKQIAEASVLQDAKAGAIQAINQKAEDIKQKISNLKNLTELQRQEALVALENERVNAILEVSDSETTSNTEQAVIGSAIKMDSILERINIENSKNLEDAINQAIAQLEKESLMQINRINSLDYLSVEDKNLAAATIKNALQDAIDKLNLCSEIEQVLDITDNTSGKFENTVQEAMLKNSKGNAIQKLREQADLHIKNVSLLKDVSSNEIEQTIAELIDARDFAVSLVNDAENVEGITAEELHGFTSMQSIVDRLLSVNNKNVEEARNNAKEALREEAISYMDAIDALQDLTAQEKDILKSKIQADLDEGLSTLDTLLDIGSIQVSQENTSNHMQATLEEAKLLDSKKNAIASLRAEHERLKSIIENLSAVTKEEKQQAIELLDSVYVSAVTAINAATTQSVIDSEKTQGVQKMNSIVDDLEAHESKLISDAIEKGLQKLKTLVNEHKLIIDELENLTEADRVAAKAEIDRIYKERSTAIINILSINQIDTELEKADIDLKAIIDAWKYLNASTDQSDVVDNPKDKNPSTELPQTESNNENHSEVTYNDKDTDSIDTIRKDKISDILKEFEDYIKWINQQNNLSPEEKANAIQNILLIRDSLIISIKSANDESSVQSIYTVGYNEAQDLINQLKKQTNTLENDQVSNSNNSNTGIVYTIAIGVGAVLLSIFALIFKRRNKENVES